MVINHFRQDPGQTSAVSWPPTYINLSRASAIVRSNLQRREVFKSAPSYLEWKPHHLMAKSFATRMSHLVTTAGRMGSIRSCFGISKRLSFEERPFHGDDLAVREWHRSACCRPATGGEPLNLRHGRTPPPDSQALPLQADASGLAARAATAAGHLSDLLQPTSAPPRSRPSDPRRRLRLPPRSKAGPACGVGRPPPPPREDRPVPS